jgi:hypothetical protein
MHLLGNNKIEIKFMKHYKGNIKMKKLISIAALFLLLFVGCNDQTSITEPTGVSSNVQTIQKQEPNWISLPARNPLQLNKINIVSKVINGAYGGSLIISDFYTAYSMQTLDTYDNVIQPPSVTTYASLVIPAGAFSGKKTITMTSDDAVCAFTFGPSQVFNKNAVFNATFTGVDLSGVDPAKVKFAYLADDGSIQYAPNDGIVVDVVAGKLQVINAQIPHFSRYGFVN